MDRILLGNIISFVGCALMVAIGLIKSKKKIMLTQCVQFSIQAVGNYLLGAISGAVCGVVGIGRNLIIDKVRHVSAWKLAFIAIQIALTLWLDEIGFMMCLPILSAVIFTWFIDVKTPVMFKLVIIVAQSLWIVYDLYYRNYAATAFDIFTVLSNFVGIVLIKRARQK